MKVHDGRVVHSKRVAKGFNVTGISPGGAQFYLGEGGAQFEQSEGGGAQC